MTIEVYRSLSGLGTRVTGQPVRSYVPWVDSDGTYCLQVGELCNTGGAIKYTVAYDAANEEATLSAIYKPLQGIPISNITDLQKIGNDTRYPLDRDYYLTGDIDASDTATWNGGAGFDPIGQSSPYFTGTLYGNGYTISNLTINRPAENYVGLFGRTGTGARIEYLTVTGSVTGNNYTGGIVGYPISMAIHKSAASVTVTGYNSVGGIAGFCLGSTIEYSYSSGSVTGNTYVGGLCGSIASSTTITKCYSYGAVAATVTAGGLVGYKVSGTITNCFYDSDTSGQSDTGNGDPKTTIEMKTATTFSAWPSIYWTCVDGAYPALVAYDQGSTIDTETGTATALTLDTETTLTAGDYWMKVTRISDGLTGNLVIHPLLVQNNDIAQSDQTDPSSAVTYRCVFLYNATGATATINTVTCAGGVEVSVDATASETTVTIADEDTAPTGPSFSATPSPALSLAAGAFVPMWIGRTVDETAGEHTPTIEIAYNTTESIVLSGSYVTSDTSIPAYYLYKGFDEAGNGTTIDNTTVDNRDDVTALPFTVDVGALQDALHGLGFDEFTMRVALRAATTAGVQSQNQLLDYALTLNYTTGDITTPNAPVIDTVEYLDGGHVRLVVDHDQASGMTRATKLVATCNGSGATETITRNLSRSEDTTETEIIFQTPVVWGASCTVTAKTLDADNHESAVDSDTQTAIFEYGADVGTFAPAPSIAATPQYTDEYTTHTWGDVDVITAPGLTEITVNGTAVFTARSHPTSRNKLTTLALTGGTITGGSYADVIEPVSATVFYFCAGGSRVAKVDTGAGTLTCPIFNDTAGYDCPVEGPYKEQGNTVYWQYFDAAANRWKPFMIVDLDNTAVHFIQNLECI